MANAYGSLVTLALVLGLISCVGVSVWGRFAMHRSRKLADRSSEQAELLNKVGFAFRSLAFVPVLGLVVFVPPFRCSGTACDPSDYASSGLALSVIVGLVASVLWVVVQGRRAFVEGVAGDVDAVAGPSFSLERTLFVAAVVLAILALLLMVLNLPS